MGIYMDLREEKTGYCLTQKQIDSLSKEEKESRDRQMKESRFYINHIKFEEENL